MNFAPFSKFFSLYIYFRERESMRTEREEQADFPTEHRA